MSPANGHTVCTNKPPSSTHTIPFSFCELQPQRYCIKMASSPASDEHRHAHTDARSTCQRTLVRGRRTPATLPNKPGANLLSLLVHYNSVIKHIIGIHTHTAAHWQKHREEHKPAPRSSCSAGNTVPEMVSTATHKQRARH